MTSNLFLLPPDVLLHIYKYMNVRDISCISTSCKDGNTFKKNFCKKLLNQLDIIQYILKRDYKRLLKISNRFTVRATYNGLNLVFSNINDNIYFKIVQKTSCKTILCIPIVNVDKIDIRKYIYNIDYFEGSSGELSPSITHYVDNDLNSIPNFNYPKTYHI
jgi:hypothetical protein